MQKIVILRFGPPIPIPEINAALRPHFADQAAKAFPMPGGVMSVFNTNSTIEEVTNSVKEAVPGLPFFIFSYDPKGRSLPQPLIDAIESDAEPTSNGAQATATELTIDEILEKITASGMESLTPSELAVLNANRRSEG